MNTANDTQLPRRRGRKNADISPDDLPNQVRTLRILKKLTLKDLADRIGCRPHTLQEFEVTGTRLNTHKRMLLADELGVSFGELLEPGKNFAEKIRQSP